MEIKCEDIYFNIQLTPILAGVDNISIMEQIFYKSISEGERFGRLVIGQVFIEILQDLSSFYIDTPEHRYEKFVKKHSDLQQRISQYHIASYVGVKPQSLSRIRKRISNQK